MAQTLYWYDLETFGLNPMLDRIAQFAGVRTNDKFEIISEPLVIYNRITPDYVPDPKACLVTGITPKQTLEKGIREYDFAKRILDEFSVPGTCVTGYNNLNFDDEFIRNLLYRNFFDPYVREWANGNSRWDIIDLVRAAHDLRPEGINWVVKENGIPSFKLEELSKANGISHDNAHDALSDVFATIDLAKLIHEKQPRLFRYIFNNRSKSKVRELVNIHKKEPFLFTSSVFTSERGCTSIAAPLVTDPGNSNLIHCYDLRYDPRELLELSVDQIREKAFAPIDKENKEDRLHFVRLHVNKCPVIAPLKTLDKASADRLALDTEKCMIHREILLKEPLLTQKLFKVFEREDRFQAPDTDPELQIYSGGFFKESDKKTFELIHATPENKIPGLKPAFNDPRLGEMFWRFICRNFPSGLNEKTKKEWKSFCAGRILSPPGKMINDFDFFKRKIKENMESKEVGSREKVILKDLDEYAAYLEREILSF